MKRASWEADESPSEESAGYRKGMAVSNLFLWKKDSPQHVFVGHGQGCVCVCVV